MANYDHVVIVGVGLLGGSIGLALRSRGLASRISGIGRNESRLQRAQQLGAIDDYATSLDDISTATLAIVCTPVQHIALWVADCLNASKCIVTDVGSTKATICAQIQSLTSCSGRFCGSHPMAGSEKDGVEHATAGLFEGRLSIVTPTDSTKPEVCHSVEQFWTDIGCRTIRLTPGRHDLAVAATSHTPHIVAAALAASTDSELLPMAASGWADTTRVAGGSPELWRQIICENREPIAASIRGFAATLQIWLDAIDAGDAARIEELLALGKQKRDSLGN